MQTESSVFAAKSVQKTFKEFYSHAACMAGTNQQIVRLVKEGLRIRSISRIVGIAVNTVMKRIIKVAKAVIKPAIVKGRTYETDELKTYMKKRPVRFGLSTP